MKSVIPQTQCFMLPLSPYEIITDIGEIQKKNTSKAADIDPSIVDSDNQSIESDEILDSFYPVQPRYHPLDPSGELTNHAHLSTKKKTGIECIKAKVDMKTVDVGESLSFLREVKKSFKDLHDTENAREELETIAKAYSYSLEKECNKYLEQRPAEENYVRLIQGLYIRNIRQHSAQSKQLSMLCHSYMALKRKREAEEELASHCKQLQALLGNSNSHDNVQVLSVDAKQQLQNGLSAGAVKVLRVQEANTTNEIVLFVGQFLRTPMGPGKLVALNHVDKKGTIQLGFGIMYSSLATVMSWSKMEKERFDCTSEESLLHHWESLKAEYTGSVNDRAVMKEILEGASTSLAIIGAEELEAFIPPALEQSKMDIDDASAEGSTLDTNPPTFSQYSDHNGKVFFSDSNISKRAPTDIVASSTAGSNNGHSNSNSNSNSNRSSCRTRAAASLSDFDKVVGRVFPLTLKDHRPSESSVKKVEKFIRRTYKAQDNSVSSQSLPMAFIHPASLAVTLRKPPQTQTVSDPFSFYNATSKPALQSTSILDGNAHKRRIKGVCYDITALSDSFNPTAATSAVYPSLSYGDCSSNRTGDGDSDREEDAERVATEEWSGARLGSSASLTWTGDILSMRKTLQGIENKVQQLEQEQAQKQKMIERFRMEEAKLSSETTALRLATFTRRIMHRNNLSNHGIVVQTPVTPAAPVVKMGLRGGTTNNNNNSNNNNNNNNVSSSNGNNNGSANAPLKNVLGQPLAVPDAITTATAAVSGKQRFRNTGLVPDGNVLTTFQKPESGDYSTRRRTSLAAPDNDEQSLASGSGSSSSNVWQKQSNISSIADHIVADNGRSQRSSASKNNRNRNRHSIGEQQLGQGGEDSTCAAAAAALEQDESDAGTEDNASTIAAAAGNQTLLGKRKSIETKKDGDGSILIVEDTTTTIQRSSSSSSSSSTSTSRSDLKTSFSSSSGSFTSSGKQPTKKNRKS